MGENGHPATIVHFHYDLGSVHLPSAQRGADMPVGQARLGPPFLTNLTRHWSIFALDEGKIHREGTTE